MLAKSVKSALSALKSLASFDDYDNSLRTGAAEDAKRPRNDKELLKAQGESFVDDIDLDRLGGIVSKSEGEVEIAQKELKKAELAYEKATGIREKIVSDLQREREEFEDAERKMLNSVKVLSQEVEKNKNELAKLSNERIDAEIYFKSKLKEYENALGILVKHQKEVDDMELSRKSRDDGQSAGLEVQETKEGLRQAENDLNEAASPYEGTRTAAVEGQSNFKEDQINAERSERLEFLKSQFTKARRALSIAESERTKAEGFAKENLNNDRRIIQEMDADKAKLIEVEGERLKAEKLANQSQIKQLENLAALVDRLKQERLEAEARLREKDQKYNAIARKLSDFQKSSKQSQSVNLLQEIDEEARYAADLLTHDQQLLQKSNEERIQAQRDLIELEGNVVKAADQIELDQYELEKARNEVMKAKNQIMETRQIKAAAADNWERDQVEFAKVAKFKETAVEVLGGLVKGGPAMEKVVEKDRARLALIKEEQADEDEIAPKTMQEVIDPDFDAEPDDHEAAEEDADEKTDCEQDEHEFPCAEDHQSKTYKNDTRHTDPVQLELEKIQKERHNAEELLFQKSELERIARENIDRDILALEKAEQARIDAKQLAEKKIKSQDSLVVGGESSVDLVVRSMENGKLRGNEDASVGREQNQTDGSASELQITATKHQEPENKDIEKVGKKVETTYGAKTGISAAVTDEPKVAETTTIKHRHRKKCAIL